MIIHDKSSDTPENKNTIMIRDIPETLSNKDGSVDGGHDSLMIIDSESIKDIPDPTRWFG